MGTSQKCALNIVDATKTNGHLEYNQTLVGED